MFVPITKEHATQCFIDGFASIGILFLPIFPADITLVTDSDRIRPELNGCFWKWRIYGFDLITAGQLWILRFPKPDSRDVLQTTPFCRSAASVSYD